MFLTALKVPLMVVGMVAEKRRIRGNTIGQHAPKTKFLILPVSIVKTLVLTRASL